MKIKVEAHDDIHRLLREAFALSDTERNDRETDSLLSALSIRQLYTEHVGEIAWSLFFPALQTDPGTGAWRDGLRVWITFKLVAAEEWHRDECDQRLVDHLVPHIPWLLALYRYAIACRTGA